MTLALSDDLTSVAIGGAHKGHNAVNNVDEPEQVFENPLVYYTHIYRQVRVLTGHSSNLQRSSRTSCLKYHWCW